MPRAKKPVELKILEGTYRRDRDGPLPDTAATAGGEPTPPPDLAGEALAFWNAVVPDLVRRRAVAAIDSHQLARLCWWEAESRRLMGLFTAAGDDDPKQSRRILMMLSVASDRFDRLAAKYGLSPGDRARMPAPPDPASARPGVASRKRDGRPKPGA